MKRGTGFARRAELARTGGPERRTELKRTAGLKPRSAKTAKKYRVRSVLVAELLETRPWCEIRWDARCQGRAIEVDEILSRGRGGDYCDPDNCQTTCRACHDAKHGFPLEAVRRKAARNSWEPAPATGGAS